MNTFKDLYIFLQQYEKPSIIDWLNDHWIGKDKQESLLRLFAGLCLIDKLKHYDTCHGNFNLQTISKIRQFKDVFYNNNELINLKDTGDSSDLTCISKTDDKHLLLTTSKNITKLNINKLDIEKILINFQRYTNYTRSLCFCIRSIDKFKIMLDNVKSSNNELKSIIEQNDNIVIDWCDLNQAYHQFKLIFQNISFDNVIKSNKNPLCLKMHQELGVIKTMRMKSEEISAILWGHIQRSGKSYIIGGTIIQDSIKKDKCSYLILTTAPNETIDQQRKVFDCFQLRDFNIIALTGNNKKPELADKNIILCSTHFLKKKIDDLNDDKNVKSIPWLKKLKFDMRFIDESHNGATTDLAKKVLACYGPESFTVQITATYSKPVSDYNISKDRCILWDLEDIKLCKNIDRENNMDILVRKHGPELYSIKDNYSMNSIKIEYSKYPDLWLLTDELSRETIVKIINSTRDNEYGWSTSACFLLKQNYDDKQNKIVCIDEFQKESETLKLWYRIFGQVDEFGIPSKEYPDNKVFLKRVERICKNPDINSRFIGEGDFTNEPMIIMAFLPQTHINDISNATIKLLKDNNVLPNYEIISINGIISSNPKQVIEDARIRARTNKKKGVLVLSGKQCSLGVSIDNCDIVLLLNNSMKSDMIYQMMFRCMTEGNGKKCGFVIDLNINRVLESTLIDYATIIKPDLHPRDAIKYISQERLINLNGDHWMPTFGNSPNKLNEICNNVYEAYSSNTESALTHFLNRLKLKSMLLSQEDQSLINGLFTIHKTQKETIAKILKPADKIKPGIEKIKVICEEKSNPDEEKSDLEDNINCMEIIRHLIPLICLLTIHDEDTTFVEMFQSIDKNETIKKILIEQTKSWWGGHIEHDVITNIIDIYVKYMSNDKETNQIIRTVKELFIKNISNNNQLSQLIDKYIIPQELEKKTNAEVSTPYKLRQEMLDKIPADFWTKPHTVFEPCSGKGGFVIDIIDRFMTGLTDSYPDEKQRYKIIVDQCLYFSDINPTNIFICQLLIDPYNEYKLNYNEGDTLKLDITTKWNIEGFDAVIGNPPYQAVSENGISKGGGNNLYTKFIYLSDKVLNISGYILFINPPTYFSPGRSNNKNDMNLRKDVLDKYYYHHINLEECSKHFNVGSKFIYYLIQKTNTNNNSLEIICKYNKKIYNTVLNQKLLIRDYLPYLLTNQCLVILDKIKSNNTDKLNIFHSPDNRSDKKHVLNKNKHETTEDYKIRAFENGYIYPMQATSVQIVYSSKSCKNQTNKKILMSESGYLKPFYDDGIIGVGGHCFACLVNNIDNGMNIIKLLTSKLYTFYIETNKWSGFHNKSVLQDLPNIKLEHMKITDENLYKFFNITTDEIKLIESSSM